MRLHWGNFMRLPFTKDEFFDVFAAYNGALWPAVVALWLASTLTCIWLVRSRRPHDRAICGLLTVHWTWSALAYHAAFFTQINPAAWAFAAVFLVQAMLFFWFGVVRQQLSFAVRRTTWTAIGWILVVYALAYPAINVMQHGSLLRIPTFGVPCPTTILTGGLLLLASPTSRILGIVPLVWAVIGGSAAVFLGVGADYALPVTAVCTGRVRVAEVGNLTIGPCL